MYEIEILTKKGFKNVRGEHTLSEISGIGVKDVNKVEYSALYSILGDISSAEAKTIGCELLSDKITETFQVKKDGVSSKSAAVIEVWFKRGVTDTVADSVVKAVKDLGITKDISVKTGHKYYLYGKVSRSVLDKIATGLLANTLIQEYKIK